MMAHSGASGSGSGESAVGRGFRWTDLFGGGSSTGHSDTGGNSVGSSEASINQPGGGGPLIPEDPNNNHLMPAQERMEELGPRLSLTKNFSRKEWASIIAAQIVVEESVEAALVGDGYPPDAILAKRHQIRGFMFYPAGACLAEKTSVGYVTSIENFGTRASVRSKPMIYPSYPSYKGFKRLNLVSERRQLIYDSSREDK